MRKIVFLISFLCIQVFAEQAQKYSCKVGDGSPGNGGEVCTVNLEIKKVFGITNLDSYISCQGFDSPPMNYKGKCNLFIKSLSDPKWTCSSSIRYENNNAYRDRAVKLVIEQTDSEKYEAALFLGESNEGDSCTLVKQ